MTDIELVRVSAKELTSLIMDEERLRTERSDRKSWKSRVTGINEYGPQSGGFGEEPQRPRRTRTDPPRNRTDEEDAHYRLAIEASKYEAEEDQKRRARNSATEGNDDDLAKAIKLSKEEEELRRKELEESNASSLFDDTPAPQQPQQTGWNQGYQQGGGVDWFGNPVDQGQQQQQQQPQNTGYLNSLYSQPTGFQQQPTGYQDGFQPQQTGFQPQQTGFDQSQFQPQQPNYLQQQNTLQPQQTAIGNPYAQQNDPNSIFGQSQQQQPLQTGAHNPWASPNNTQQDALKPTPTGSNNPFASSFNRPQHPSAQSQPTLSTLQEQKTATQFNQPSYNNINNSITSYQPSPSSQQPQQQPPQPKLESDPNRARLNALLASGEGMDTFGNTGDLRIPAQHTAPGTFVNSSGQGLNRLHGQQTGNNPFFNQQQFTGAPQQQGVGGGFAARPQQTGPAGGGFGGNPYAGSGAQGGGQANLIDI